jgi:hypothetical protein
MNSPNKQQLDQKLQQLEAEINQHSTHSSSVENSGSLESTKNQFLNWYKELPQMGQIIVLIGGAVVGLSMLGVVFQLIRLAVSLAILGVLGYVGYRFFWASQSSQNPNS